MFRRLAPRASRDPAAAVAELPGWPGSCRWRSRCWPGFTPATRPGRLADLIRETEASLLTLAAEKGSVAAAFERFLPVPGRQASSVFFRRLGLHPGTTIDAYAAAALTGLTRPEAAGHLNTLHGEGLLTEACYRRYGMHDLIRSYAQHRAAADPAADRDRALGPPA